MSGFSPFEEARRKLALLSPAISLRQWRLQAARFKQMKVPKRFLATWFLFGCNGWGTGRRLIAEERKKQMKKRREQAQRKLDEARARDDIRKEDERAKEEEEKEEIFTCPLCTFCGGGRDDQQHFCGVGRDGSVAGEEEKT